MYRNSRFVISAVMFCFLFVTTHCFGIEQSQIHFYGKVVDQFNQPVSDVAVTLGIRLLSAEGKDDSVKAIAVKTNSDGLFELTDSGTAVYISFFVRPL